MNLLAWGVVGVTVWYFVGAIRQAARDFQADDRYDVFGPVNEPSGEWGDEEA